MHCNDADENSGSLFSDDEVEFDAVKMATFETPVTDVEKLRKEMPKHEFTKWIKDIIQIGICKKTMPKWRTIL